MLGYLCLDIICSSKLTVVLELCSRKTVRFSGQIMSADKYPSIFSRQMKAIAYLLSEVKQNIVICLTGRQAGQLLLFAEAKGWDGMIKQLLLLFIIPSLFFWSTQDIKSLSYRAGNWSAIFTQELHSILLCMSRMLFVMWWALGQWKERKKCIEWLWYFSFYLNYLSKFVILMYNFWIW